MSARTRSERGRKDAGRKTNITYLVECKRYGKWEQPEGEESRRKIREWKERGFLCLACRIQALEVALSLRDSRTRRGDTGTRMVNQLTQTSAKKARGEARGEASIAEGAESTLDLWQREELFAVTQQRTVMVEGRRFKSQVQYILYERVRASGRDRQVAVQYLDNLQELDEWIEGMRRMLKPSDWTLRRRDLVRRFLKRKVEQHADVRDRPWELRDLRWVKEEQLWQMDGESQGRIVGEEYERLMIVGEL